MEWLFRNPVFIKEMRSKMRQRRAYTVLTFYLIILGFVFYLCYGMNVLSEGHIYYVKSDSYAGKYIFIVIAIMQLLLMMSTALTSSITSITLEKEERTYDLLRVTPITPFSIVMGKLLFSLAYIFLLFVISIPIAFLIPYLSGLSFIQVLKVYLVIMATAVTLSLCGIYCSTIFSKSSHATGVFYGILFIFVLLPSLFLFGVGYFEVLNPDKPLWAGITANPFWTISGILIGNDTTRIYQFNLPISLLYFITNLLLSFFIGSLAINNLRERSKRSTVWIRVSFLILFLFITFINLGSINFRPKFFYDFSTFISLQIMLFILIGWIFCFGDISQGELKFSSLFKIKRIFYNQPSTSLLYLTLLVITSSGVIISCAYSAKIFPKWHLLCLISLGILMITLAWGSLGLLLNSLFKSRLASRGIFVFIFIIVTLGIILPGMPHYISDKMVAQETTHYTLVDMGKMEGIGKIMIHLHPLFSVRGLIGDEFSFVNLPAMTFFWSSMFFYTIFFLLNMLLKRLFKR
ncbi:MAG: ABC transporter permease subunit [bacterium]